MGDKLYYYNKDGKKVSGTAAMLHAVSMAGGILPYHDYVGKVAINKFTECFMDQIPPEIMLKLQQAFEKQKNKLLPEAKGGDAL